ncbi:hypothetical protein IV203_012333 [Nitzschia inconspicua]|uniref:Uncharacterized protein n=1 Tax=Nitzschia inconspicua TaxID=303405 RepID=A0A9K3PK47_9STRA|nr:hypothetical protein IV203_012333 [Nitzschia inconspicua]
MSTPTAQETRGTEASEPEENPSSSEQPQQEDPEANRSDEDDDEDLFGTGTENEDEPDSSKDKKQVDEEPGADETETPAAAASSPSQSDVKEQPEPMGEIQPGVKKEDSSEKSDLTAAIPRKNNVSASPGGNDNAATADTEPEPQKAEDSPIKSDVLKGAIPRKSSAANVSNNSSPSKALAEDPRATKYGLPKGVTLPKTVKDDALSGRLLETLQSLPLQLINDALQEYDDAVQTKGNSIRNHSAYLFGVIKRYVSVQERAN